jgi:hypothetical protein
MTAPSAPSPRTALRGVLGGTLAGAAIVSLVLAQVRAMVERLPAADVPAMSGNALTLLIFGVFFGVVAAAAVAFWGVGAMPTLFRRAALALAAGLGTVLVAMVAVPLHHVAGRTGLHALAAVAAVASLALLATRRA